MENGEKNSEVTPAKETTIKQTSKLKQWLKRYWVTLTTVLSVAILSLVLYCTGGISDDISAYGYYGVLIVSVLASTVIFIPVPSIPVVFLMGIMLNPFLVGLTSGLGETIGEISAYTAGLSGRETFSKKERYTKIRKWMERRGTLVLFLFAAVPNMFFKLVGAAAAAMRYPFWKFILVVFIGKTIKGMTIAFAGYYSLRLLLGWLIKI